MRVVNCYLEKGIPMLNEALFKTDIQTETASKKFSMYESVKSFAHNYLKNLDTENEDGNLYQLILGKIETALFEKLLEFTNGNESRSAKIIGISRGTFRTKCKDYGINSRKFKWTKPQY
jgi:Fis family transcriptional regulator, factor for inversion stimulation protein